MKKFLLPLMLSLFGGSILFAQTTTITATVVDTDGTTWANGSWKIAFNPNPSQPNINIYNQSGTPLSQSVMFQSGSLNGSGALSLSVYTSNTISPAGSTWTITVCPLATAPCGVYQFAAAGASMDLSSALTPIIPAPRFLPGAGAFGYADLEAQVALNQGSFYWNVNNGNQRFWNGSAWIQGGAGTGTVNPGSNFRLAAYPSTTAQILNPTTNVTTDSTLSGVYAAGTSPPGGFIPNIMTSTAFYSPYGCVDVIAAGASGNGKVYTNGSITAGANILSTTNPGTFVAADVGKLVTIFGAGVAANGGGFLTTITGFTDSQHVTVQNNAITTVSGSASGRIATNDFTGITNAINTALANSSNPLPICFPHTGGFYMSTTLTWRGVSMRGLDGGITTAQNGPAVLYGVPGQDLWLYPDPNDTITILLFQSMRATNMAWVVDSSIDTSSSGTNAHPHRKLGRTADSGLTSVLGNNVITSTTYGCLIGDIGQAVNITYSDTGPQQTTITGCDATSSAGGTHITLAANATSNNITTLYTSVMGLGATQTLGNCALAIDNRDQNTNNWLSTDKSPYVFTYSTFDNISIQSTRGVGFNNVAGICMQGVKGSGYANSWTHSSMTGLIYGFMMYPSDTNPSFVGGSQGCDFCRYIDFKIGANYPMVIYNGLDDRVEDLQIASTYGPQFLKVASTAEFAPSMWSVNIPDDERTSGAGGWRLEGTNFNVKNSTVVGNTVWGASNSRCDICLMSLATTFTVAGQFNDLSFDAGILTSTLSGITSNDPSNRVYWRGLGGRRITLTNTRMSVSNNKSGAFLPTGKSFNNIEDMWVYPQDVLWDSYSPALVADPTSESGWYTDLLQSAAISVWQSLGSGVHPTIGGPNANIPAQVITFSTRVQCPSLVSFTLALHVVAFAGGAHTVITSGSQPCTTSWATDSVTFDLSPYDGALYWFYISYTFTGEVKVAWQGLSVNAVTPIQCPAGNHFFSISSAGIVTCTPDSSGPGTTWWGSGWHSGSNPVAASAANVTNMWSFYLPYPITVTKISWQINTADNTANKYDIGVYPYSSPSGGATTLSGNCHIGGTAGTTFANVTGAHSQALLGTCVLTQGPYVFALTTNCASACAALSGTVSVNDQLFMGIAGVQPSSGSTTSGGVLNTSITVPAESWTPVIMPEFYIHQ